MHRTRFTDITRQLAVPLGACACLFALPAQAECDALPEARFEARLGGAINATLDWSGAELSCDAMARPDGEGQRLRFRGPLAPDLMLTVVIGIDGLVPGMAAQELPVNLTLVLEEQGRFFSSRQQDSCWADVTENRPAGRGHRLSAEVYCVRGLAALDTEASVSVASLRFTGPFGLPADEEHAP